MIPKKIYLNGGDENAVTICSREPITRSYGNTHSREYTDLSQVWHPASEPPQPYLEIIVEQYNRGGYSNNYWVEYLIPDEIDGFCKHSDYHWAYITDLLPPASCSEIPNNSSKKSNS